MKPSTISRVATSLIKAQIPFYVKGPVGAGKSQLIQQVCDELGYELRDVRLSQMDPTDIKGFPCPDNAKGVMKWLPPDFFPPMNAKTKGLIFMDELSSAPQATQAAAYQLTLDRRVGNYILPKGWTVAAAGNRDIDRSIVNRMPAALANRLVHLDYDVDLDDFVAHAMKSGIEPSLIAFLRFKSNLLHSFDPQQNPIAFPTPRTWFKADQITKLNMTSNDEYETLKGTVGEGAATEYKAFMKVIKDLPTLDEINLTPETTRVPESPSTLYALSTTLSMATTKTSFPRFMKYVERMPVEFQVTYMRDTLKLTNDVKLDKCFTAWAAVHHDVLL